MLELLYKIFVPLQTKIIKYKMINYSYVISGLKISIAIKKVTIQAKVYYLSESFKSLLKYGL